MKKIFSILLFVILIHSATACSRPVSSPVIVFENLSSNYIKNVNGNWNGYRLHGGPSILTPGQSGSENFILQKPSDLFGPVHIEWENAQRKKIVKEFVFRQEQLPEFGSNTSDWIWFYLGQEDLEMFIRANRKDSEERIKRVQKSAQICLMPFNTI
jgi:hypothetical protein